MSIRTEKLTHIYMPGTPFAAEALHEVTFALQKGQVALLIGPSGSGKSTLIQHLNGLLKPTSGQVYFDDQSIEGSKDRLLKLRRKIGLVFQLPEEQFFSETVYDEVAFAPRNLGLPEEMIIDRVHDALNMVGLVADEIKDRHPFNLSSGQKRLVAIAAVLSLKPEVLILDEPTAGLDPAGRRNLFNLLGGFNREEGMTVLISTHHFDEAVALANQVLVLKQGKLVLNGTREEVFNRREDLEKIGLALPSITELMQDLAAEGLPVRTDLYTIAAARDEINKMKEKQQL